MRALFLLFGLAISMPLQAGWALRDLLADFVFPYRFGFYQDSNLMIEMRDGIRLNATLYLPDNTGGPFPTILIRTTYGGISFEWVRLFADNGYAVLVQNVRGRYGSEGIYTSPHRYSRTDGYDSVEWIVNQPWSSGKVGSFGCSYLGEAQIMLAAAKHPNHLAMIVEGAGGAIGNAQQSYDYFGVYENGVFNLASGLGWFTADGAIDYGITPEVPDLPLRIKQNIGKLPVAGLSDRIVPFSTGFRDMVEHSLTDEWWKEEGYISEEDSFSTATLHVNAWYDQTVHDSFKLARQMADNAANPRARHQHLLIGPGLHCSAAKLVSGPVRIGEMEIQYEDIDYRSIYLDWFDYWLKGKGELNLPNIQYYLINSSSWKSASQWPPGGHSTSRYTIAAENRLVDGDPARPGAHDENYYEFRYDPEHPVPTLGGPICCTAGAEDIAGAVDQSPLKGRSDVLLFESAALERDLDLVGSARAVLYVSSSAKDTDFTVKLVDQTPQGPAYNLQDGVVRLLYRNGIENPEPARPGVIYRLELDLRPIAYRFRKGHRIAAYVSSSNFPRLARNLNTGESPLLTTDTKIATNRVYYGGENSSYFELPVIDQD
ncbi:MAG TPA: CocE/NonD family hydrolase [Gammaproteobacteria bacterium]|nr:CocE/NonD family hydrolase [Gammaproteobacteria bacterium]